MTRVLEARNLRFTYDGPDVLTGVDFALDLGELVAIVGPNGAGKSTLLHVLLGILPGAGGTVTVEGRPLTDLSRKAIARSMAFVPQSARADFAFTVRELVAMGRTPHLGRFRPPGAEDVLAVDRALALTETEPLADRYVSDLSGGERQRVHVARAIAQSTPVLLLDEPTSNLDVQHQLQLLELVRRLVSGGKGAAIAIHDLSLAARYADRVVILAEGQVALSGKPEDVFTEETLRRYFRIIARVERDPVTGRVVVLPREPLP